MCIAGTHNVNVCFSLSLSRSAYVVTAVQRRWLLISFVLNHKIHLCIPFVVCTVSLCVSAKVVICVGTEKVDGTLCFIIVNEWLNVTWKKIINKQIIQIKPHYFTVVSMNSFICVCVRACVCTSWSKRACHFRHIRILINSFASNW